ncbi:protein-S-isoprenylcysteine O-methyltransferase Ste14 [Paraburkholderia youngii]
MASEDRNEKAEPAMVPPVANPGIIRPPFVYLSAIVLGVLLHFAWPVQLVPHTVSGPLGGSAVLVAVVLFLWAVRTLRALTPPCREIGPPPRS